MNPKKPLKEQAVGAGISLPRELIERGKKYAGEKGFASLSSLMKWLLTQHLAGNHHPIPPSVLPLSSLAPSRIKASPLALRAKPALKQAVESVAHAQGLRSDEWIHAVIEKAIKDGVMVRQQVSYEVVEPKGSRQRKPVRPRSKK